MIEKRRNLIQIDLLKALAIISVITIHTVSKGTLYQTYAVFHIWQAVPIFFIILGLNTGLSFKRKGVSHIKDLYSKEYFMQRIDRIIVPLLVILVASIISGYNLKAKMYFGILNFMGLLPYTGPGNYFISILLQSIFLLPSLYLFYVYNPKLMVLVSFLIDLTFQLIAPHINIFQETPYLYNSVIFRYFSAISLGLWISDDWNLFSPRNRFIIIGSFISFFYLLFSNIFIWNIPFFISSWYTQNLFSFFYPTVLIILGIKYLPSKSNGITKIFALIGKASYHIFLVQMIYFSTLFTAKNYLNKFPIYNSYAYNFFETIIDILVCIVIGILFFLVNKRIKIFS